MYDPSEDSYLLQEEIVKYCQNKVINNALDVGTGTGIQAETLGKYAKSVLAVDIDEGSLKKARVKDNVELRQSDLFSNIEKDELFDLIVFNPPYLPDDGGVEDKELIGGEKGVETTVEFLNQAEKHLKKDGCILFVASTRSDLDFLEKNTSFFLEIVRELPLFFEKLYVYKAYFEKGVVNFVEE